MAFDLPAELDLGNLADTTAVLIRSVAAGDLTPDEAQSVAAVMELHRRAVETVEIEERIRFLEEKRVR